MGLWEGGSDSAPCVPAPSPVLSAGSQQQREAQVMAASASAPAASAALGWLSSAGRCWGCCCYGNPAEAASMKTKQQKTEFALPSRWNQNKQSRHKPSHDLCKAFLTSCTPLPAPSLQSQPCAALLHLSLSCCSDGPVCRPKALLCRAAALCPQPWDLVIPSQCC